MRVLQTTLLTGPYDWDPAVLPREEFAARLERVRAVLDGAGIGALLVHGHAGDYGALNYLTGFVPKLGPAFALVPREGPIRLVVAGTPLMLPWAKRLTWVEDVRALANLPKLVADWLGDAPAALGSWGAVTMAQGLYRGIIGVAGPAGLTPLDAPLDAIRRHKSPRELHLVRRATRALGLAASALAAEAGDGNRSAALAAERAAVAAGAQDVRVQTSLRPGGTPQPLDGPEDRIVDPLLAALAVQCGGYWAAGMLTVAAHRGTALDRAEAALAAVLAAASPGARADALLDIFVTAIAPLAPHLLMRSAIGCAIGLSLDEGKLSGDAVLEPGGVYFLRAGARAGEEDSAIVSAMIAVTADGVETLWAALPR